MPKLQQVNMRLSAHTTRQLDALTDKMGTTITATVTIAIDRLYQQEIGLMTPMKLYDYQESVSLPGKVEIIVTGDQWEFGHWHDDAGELDSVAYIRWDDGSIFTPRDWQGQQPQSVNDIPEFDWLRVNDGMKAIMLDNLPRILE